MSRYFEALSVHREEIDSLNVFPVPDGDTGTNMLLTQQAVEEALRELDGAALPEVADAISRAALLGARGNSGVILSQVLRGMCERLSAKEDPGAVDLAEALADADEEARRAVGTPLEGTMLTVIRDAAEAARDTLAEDESCEVVARAALHAATASLERTRDQLRALTKAGVVDAGGKGVVLLLDALASALDGGDLSVAVGPLGPVGVRAGEEPFRETVGIGYGFEVMYLLESDDGSVGALRERLAAIGDSLVVVGGGGLYNVHVHTNEPGTAVEIGIDAGRPRQIRVASLTDQVEEACLAGQARAVRIGDERTGARSVIAVAEGDGFAAVFRSLGATVVAGGPGNNPSVGELVGAIDEAAGETVLLLPNHRNVLPAAEAAARESTKDVVVYGTPSMAHGVAVLAAYVPELGQADNHPTLDERLRSAASGAVARAERDAETEAGGVRAGDWLALAYEVAGAGERVVSVGGDVAEVATDLVGALLAGTPEGELLSVYTGAGAGEEEAARIEAALREAVPNLEIEVQAGGQPRFPYVVGLE